MLKHETIFLVVGKSGAGKTTLCDKLSQQHGLTQLWSYTTRPARYINEPGHHFVASMSRWQQLNRNEKIVAYTNFAGHDYWATESQADDCDMYVIDPAGEKFFRQHYQGKRDIVVIYIDVPWRTRVRRMRQRGDSLLRALQRVWHDFQCFAGFKSKADFVICNDDLAAAMQEMWEIMYEVDGNSDKPYEGSNIPVERVEWRNVNG